MKLLRSLIVCATLVLATPCDAALDLNRASVEHLPNGLTVIMLEDHSLPVVSVQTLYKSGSAAETRGKTGLAHFLEHLAFRGSANFPNAGATEAIYDSGGEWHGYTAMDQTTYFSTMPRDGLDLLLRIEADRMARVIIDPASIKAEQGAVITELHGYENDPASVLQEAVTRTAIQAHPYGSPMAGYVSDVATLNADDARAYYSSHYVPGNAVLAIVGDFAPDEARQLIAKHLADVPARAVAPPISTLEPVQNGERRIMLNGTVERPQFLIAYPAPSASSADFPAFLVLQQILSGSPGLNAHQDGWSISPASEGSALAGVADSVGTWLPTTRDPFLFMIGGSGDIESEQAIEKVLAALRETLVDSTLLASAKAALARTLAEDVQTTEDAAHQLAFFEGVGALDALLAMPARVAAVTASDIQRLARAYLSPDKRTVGWMLPGKIAHAPLGAGDPRPAIDRAGTSPPAATIAQPSNQTLSSGVPVFIQPSTLSNMATVQLLMSGPVADGAHPEELPGLDAIVRSGISTDLTALVEQAAAAAANAKPLAETAKSNDPSARLEQLILARINAARDGTPRPVALFVSGSVDPQVAGRAAEKQIGNIAAGALVRDAPPGSSSTATTVREQIDLPLSQGAIGYVVEGPKAGTREALAWRMLLYVLTHDYSGRLGRSAISDKGLVYYIGSAQRSDGARTWATLSIGVDPDKADAMETELRHQLRALLTAPPTEAEMDAARRHLLGRDKSAAQSTQELAAKLARQFVEFGKPISHTELRDRLAAVSEADILAAARAFGRGTLIRVDVAPPPGKAAARP